MHVNILRVVCLCSLCTNFVEIIMRFLIIAAFLSSLSVYAEYKEDSFNEEIIRMPISFEHTQLGVSPKILSCIGEVIDFSSITLKRLIAYKNKREVIYSPETYWEKISFGNQLNVKNFKDYSFKGKAGDNLYWSSNQGSAKLNLKTDRFTANKDRIQLQAICKLKHKNWNEFGN